MEILTEEWIKANLSHAHEEIALEILEKLKNANSSIDNLIDGKADDYDLYLGAEAGKDAVGEKGNTVVGQASGTLLTTGQRNVLLGLYAGYALENGSHNIAIGQAMSYNKSGNKNIAIGYRSLYTKDGINNNIAIGYHAGYAANGDNNILIGNLIGYNHIGNNKLMIDISNTANPLIWGDFEDRKLKFNINNLNLSNLPTNDNGLVQGDVWNDNGVLKIK